MKRGIDIIRAMLKVDRIAEEEAARHKQPLPCRVLYGEGAGEKLLGPEEFQRAVCRGAKVPYELVVHSEYPVTRLPPGTLKEST